MNDYFSCKLYGLLPVYRFTFDFRTVYIVSCLDPCKLTMVRMMKRFYSVLIFFLLTTAITQAQDYSAYNWYFGNSTLGLRFTRGDTSATATLLTNQRTPFGTGGSAVATDPVSGNLIFYTDGINVIDASHQLMSGSPIVGSSTRNQPVAICKNPATKGQYLIFSNNGTAVRVSAVDSVANGNENFQQPPLWNVTTPKNQVVAGLPATLSEGMIMLYDQPNNDFWLMTHQTGTTNYHFVQISETGINYVGFVSVGLIENVANLAYHPGTNRIAVSPREANRDVEILNITFPATLPGIPTLASTRLNNASVSTVTTEAIYDTEFSSSGQYLYVSVFGEGAATGNVLQYDLTDPLLTAQSILPSLPTESYGLQMGPDGIIYHLYQSGANFLLGGIQSPDSLFNDVDYDPTIFNGNFGGRQFPAFAPADSLDMKVFFTSDGTCANAPTAFFPTVTPGADSLVWDFGDGTTSSDWAPVYTYTAGGTYDVTVTAYLNGQVKDTVRTITIQDFDTQIDLVQDTTACSCELLFPKAVNPPAPPAANPCDRFTLTANLSGSGSPTWQWFGPAGAFGPPGSGTTATLQPDSAGYYYLVATVGSCQTYAGVNIKEYNVQDQRSNIWYFGQNAGIDFNPVFDNPPGAPEAISNPVMDAPEGTSTISDRNGQVIFFTDGDKVWDRNFTEIANGIGGDVNSTQSALIIPVPGDETLYYIFTTQEIYGGYGYRLSYSLFDLKLNSGLGGMRETNVTLFYPSTERITSNGNWLVAHEYGNNSFRAYQVTSIGISNPVISSIGSDHSTAFAENGEGYMKFGPNNRLAVAISTPGVSNIVEVFDFVDSTGVVTNLRTANLNSTTGQVYGIEFSGDKMFATLSGTTSKLYEFFFDTLGMVYEVKKTPPPMSATVINEELGAIQVGPDGQLYVAVNNKPYLGVITVNGDTTIASTYNTTQFPLAGATTSRLGLPNFIQVIADQPSGPSLSFSGVCIGSPTDFFGSGTDRIDTLTWAFGDGTGMKGVNLTTVQHTYAAPGTYFVTLSISNRCVGLIEVLRDTVTIFPLPPLPAPTVLSICTPPLQLNANPSNTPNLSFLWETGATTPTINVFQPGAYDVTITGTNSGCIQPATFNVFPSLASVNLGPDQTYCSGAGTGLVMNTNININQHRWFLNGVDLGNAGPTQVADFSLPGVYTYIVEFNDAGASGCFVRDTVTYTVNQTPLVNALGNNPINCTPANGQISLDIMPVAIERYAYLIIGGPSNYVENQINRDGGVNYVSASNTLEAGTYTVQITDQVSGCIGSTTVLLTTNAFLVNNTSEIICAPKQLSISTTSALAGTYRILDAVSGAVLETGVKPAAVAPFSSANNYGSGSYQIEVTVTSCVAGVTVTFTQGPQFTVTFDQSALCSSSQVTAVAAPAAPLPTFDWSSSPTGSISGATNSATVTVNVGTHSLQVLVDDGPGLTCPTTASVTVTVDNFTPAFTFDPCTSPTILEATPTNISGTLTDYIYTWVGFEPGTGQQHSITTSGFSYTLSMQSLLSGCTKSSASTLVTISGPISVTLVPEGIACDGAPFTLIATPSRMVQGDAYEWKFEGVTQGGQNSDRFQNRTLAGLYTVTVDDGNGCTATADLDLFLAPSTPGKLFSEALICPEPENPDPNTRQALLDPGDGFVSYTWYEVINNIPSDLNFTEQVYTATYAAIFQVDLVNGFGCSSSDRTNVIVDCDPVLVGPNAFRPTNPVATENKNFKLISFFIDDSDFQIYIFNRWGEMVFQSTDRLFEWNGGYNNNASQLLPAGTYTYVVRYKSSYRPEEGAKEKRGGVMLLR